MDRERVFYLFDRHVDGTWMAEEKQELEVYLLNSPEVQRWFWDHARLSNVLREACQVEAGSDMAEVDGPSVQQVAEISTADGAACSMPDMRLHDASAAAPKPPVAFISSIFSPSVASAPMSWPKISALVVVAMLLSSVATYLWIGGKNDTPGVLAEHAKNSSVQSPPSDTELTHAGMHATLVNVTSCRWDPARSTADLEGGTVRPGQSLSLLEGVAEINTTLSSGGFGCFQLEGPLSMILTSEGMPSLQHGKLAAQVTCDFDHFTFDTPLGRVVLSHEASIGLAVAANEVELHVFAGEATFESLWAAQGPNAPGGLNIASGASIRISVGSDGTFSVDRNQADESRFVTHVSMAASRLGISNRYVSEIRKSQPIAYWRFESDADGLIRNEMSDKFHCRIHGEGIRWHNYSGNRAVEFGSTPEVGCLMTDDTLDGVISSSYCIEAWIKPSHYHHGSVCSFINWPGNDTKIPRHGMLLEICGPVVGPVGGVDSWARYPGRIRFLHRNPPGDMNGLSCYSEMPYRLRKWQHIVGIKDGADMRLYLDGQLASTGSDPTELPGGMRVLIGQLFPHNPRRVITSRPYIGELDEVAVYNRALSEAELNRHFQLARPASDPAPTAATPN